MKKKIKIVFLVLVLILIDQFIKIFVAKQENIDYTLLPGLLKISYAENPGGAYGLGSDSILVLIGVNLLLVILIIKYLIKNFKTMESNYKLSLSLILAGGISNLIDRLFRGYVVDYIDINKLLNFPVFNIADVAIVTGIVLMIITILIKVVKEQENSKKG